MSKKPENVAGLSEQEITALKMTSDSLSLKGIL